MRLSPTSIELYRTCCPAALQYYLADRALQDKEIEVDGPYAADIGIAFHWCVHAAGNAEKVIRAWEQECADKPDQKIPEPMSRQAAAEFAASELTKTMNAGRVRTGLEMALEFIRWWQFPLWGHFEHGVAFDAKWNELAWDDGTAAFRLIYDVVGVSEIEDEEYGEMNCAVAQDYKTGWGASPDLLDGLQMSAQAVALMEMVRHGSMKDQDIGAIEVHVVGTRLGKVWKKRWIFDSEEDMADLEERKRKLEWYMKCASVGDDTERIGHGCTRCNYCDRCTAFQETLKRLQTGTVTISNPEEAARLLCVMAAKSAAIEDRLKAVAESGPIQVDQSLLGYHPHKKREVADPGRIADLWFEAAGQINTVEEAKLSARDLLIALQPGVTVTEKLIKRMSRKLGFASQKQAVEELSDLFKEEEISKWGWNELPFTGSGMVR